ncbi:hypothetical protein AB0K00_25475 [Dactylosporangium sp. NPDC049525]|uniref:hypothetical protein n=1 Tax=Dactylosporangium sp. NPDC049525 TaxID=3154730 RepID=UPI0034461496
MDTSPHRAAAFRAVERARIRTRILWIVAIVAGVLPLLCWAGGYGYQVVTGERDRTVLRGARDATERFVRDLELDDHPAAYGLLCAGTRDELTLDQFESGLRGQPHIRAHRNVHAFLRAVDEHAGAAIVEELTLDNGSVDTHTFTLFKENGAWRVCNRSWPY